MSSGAVVKAIDRHASEVRSHSGAFLPESPTSVGVASRAAIVPAPEIELEPFPEREYIDVARAARILGVSGTTVRELYERGLIEMVDYAPRKRKRVLYRSIVDFCDHLRRRYCIKDRRPTLDSPVFRHRDEHLLPFPISDTITIEQTAEILGYSSPTPVRLMIEEGRFEAYQFFPCKHWRISRVSLAKYLNEVGQRMNSTPSRVTTRNQPLRGQPWQ
jgi:excisionase family DNA binding protein